MKNSRMGSIIVKSIVSGVICWFAFALGTIIVQRDMPFTQALFRGQCITMGIVMMFASFIGYWGKSKQ